MDLKFKDQKLQELQKMKAEKPGPGREPQPGEPGVTGEHPVPPTSELEQDGNQPGSGPEGAAATPEEGEDTVGAISREELDSLRAEVASKTAALAELQQRYLRLQADFDNFRKRTRREQEELTRLAAARLITGLLPVVDNLERALATAADSKGAGLAAGVELIQRQLMTLLEQEGLTPVAAVGQPFNPELHEAVAREETGDPEQANLVVAEFRRGYTLHGKLLRPAMVKVAVAGATVKENGQEVDKNE
ncbi:nucleotide exchange factor GrpE [Moorella sp. Hama-1]|uniref:nucleotide exchange factor GrpE n=1 Tax=Moorella sp. Hama-1 TaxID=2138101 RepID=UPI00137991E5|nr:nucleotide exchange factor GrpE [Moorella sp. Hama-1]BCV20562.1 protein GrpE [Moorella sp. Hama-1]